MIEIDGDDGARDDPTVWEAGAPSGPSAKRRQGVLARLARSLKVRLAVTGGLIAGASMAGIVIAALQVVEQQVVDARLHEDVLEARRVASVVESRLDVLRRAIRGAAEPVEDSEEAMHLLASRRDLLSLFDALFVASAQGRYLAYLDRDGFHPASRGMADLGYFREALESVVPIVSPPTQGQVSLRPSLQIVFASRSDEGRPVSVFGGSLTPESRSAFADLTRRQEGSSALTIIVDRDGVVVSHPDHERVLEPVFALQGVAAALPSPESLPSRRGTASLVERQPGAIVSAAAVPGSGWNVLRVTDDTVLLAELTRLRRIALGSSAAIALVAGALLFWVSWRLLGPMRQLQRRAQAMLTASENVDTGWPDGAYEIGELSRVFRHILREREAMSAASVELLARMQAILLNSPVGIAFSRERRLEMASPSLCRLLGYTASEICGMPARRIYASESAYREVGEHAQRTFPGGGTVEHEVRLLRKDATEFWGKLRGSAVDATDPAAGTIWIIEDVSQAHELRERLSWTATHDALTSLVNRREFDARLRDALARPDRGPLCVLFLDLDRFKAVNDTGGHAAGDRVLVDVARLLEAGVRATDTVARLGGDEFALILGNCAQADGQRVAEQLRRAVDEYRLRWHDEAFQVGASIGLFECGPDVTDVARAIEAADRACYAAKRDGRNRVSSYSADSPREHATGDAPGPEPIACT